MTSAIERSKSIVSVGYMLRYILLYLFNFNYYLVIIVIIEIGCLCFHIVVDTFTIKIESFCGYICG